MTILTLEAAPAAEPITLADAREQLRIDGTDEDTTLARLISTATAYMDARGALGRAMITQTWAQWERPQGQVKLYIGPFQSLTSVEYYDAAGTLQADTLSNYEAIKYNDFTVIRPKDGFSWPSFEDRPDAAKITFVAGYGDAATDVPETVRHAMLMLVTHWFERREPSSERNMQDIPWSVEALLNMERVRWYG